MRMTKKKAAILTALSANGGIDFVERGVPPYSAVDVANELHLDLSNTVKTLKLLERDGFVVRERARRECWNAIAGDGIDRTMNCYWNAATIEADKAAIEAWQAAVDDMQEKFITAIAGSVPQFEGPVAPQIASPAVPLMENIR